MKRKAFIKKVTGILMGLAVMVSSLLAPMEVRAAEKYNAEAALEYAREHWDDGKGLCAEFVSNCIEAGGCSAWSRSCTSLRKQLLDSGMGTEYELSLETDMSIKGSNYKDKLAAGDVVFYYCPGCTDGKPYIHAVLSNGVDSNGYMTAFSHNSANSGSKKYKYSSKCYACNTKISKAYVYHFNTDSVPIGYIDMVSGGNGSITVYGWSLDKDSPEQSIDIHIYVGGPAGSGAQVFSIRADKERKDVDKAHGLGAYHGFSETIKIDARGKQDIYVYAINANGGENTFMGCRQVDIKEEYNIIFDSSQINIKENETQTVSFTFKGDGIYQMVGEQKNEEAAQVFWSTVDWKNGRASLNVQGHKSGSDKLTIKLLNSNNEVLHKETIEIIVTAEAKVNDEIQEDNEEENTTDENFEKVAKYTEKMMSYARKMGLSEKTTKKYVSRLLELRGWGEYTYLVDIL